MKKSGKRTNKAVKCIFTILACILGAVLIILAVMFTIPLTERVDTTPVDGSADWMSRLPDGAELKSLSIPGTHDAGTQFVQLGFFSKCQARSIGEQLEEGFRYLDIRLEVSGGGMRLTHGFCVCKTGAAPWARELTLDGVLSDCCAFLSAHPTETVIFAVKQEHGDESVTEFEAALEKYVSAAPEYWYIGNELPTLGEARGKLVLLRRYEDGAKLGVPLLWPNQNGFEDPSRAFASENCGVGSLPLYVQDRYEYDTDEKWAAFCAEAPEDGVTVRFLSTKGHAAFGHPYKYAKALNPRLLKLCLEQRTPLGWTVVDFGNAKLASSIYELNF